MEQHLNASNVQIKLSILLWNITIRFGWRGFCSPYERSMKFCPFVLSMPLTTDYSKHSVVDALQLNYLRVTKAHENKRVSF